MILGIATALSWGSQESASRQKALDGLVGLVKVPLSKGKHCSTARVRSTDKTVGDLLAGYLALLGDRSLQNWVEAKCEPSGKTEQCSVLFRSDPGGESPMASGFTFRVTRSNPPNFVSGSLVCTGT